MDKFDYGMIPDRTMQALKGWVTEGLPTGDFLRAVLSNQLSEAVGKADDENLYVLPQIAMFIYNRCPQMCWGNPGAVKDWPSKLLTYKEAGSDPKEFWRDH